MFRYLKAPVGIAALIAAGALNPAAAGQAARLGDTVTGVLGLPATITGGAPSVLINGAPAARAGDGATCYIITDVGPALVPGVIVGGNLTVLIEGAAAARLGDAVSPSCTITTGSTDVQD